MRASRLGHQARTHTRPTRRRRDRLRRRVRRSSSAPAKYTWAQALVDINSPDKQTFCRAFEWDLGNTGFMSLNMVKRQYVRPRYGTPKQFEAKAEKMNCH